MTPSRLASLRHLGRHPWQLALSLLSIALGIAVVVAVDLVNESASRAFELSREQILGDVSHQVLGPPDGFDEAIYVDLRLSGHRDIAPVVEGPVSIDGRPARLVGIDPFAVDADGPLTGMGESGLRELVVTPDTIVLAPPTAHRLGVGPGDTVAVDGGAGAVEATVAGVMDVGGRRAAAVDGILVADIATAQEMLGRVGRLDRIDVHGGDGLSLAAALPPGLRLVDAGARSAQTLQMSRAFSINLEAMSLLALLVGMFLIYNTMTFSVLQRRRILATLRAMGATRAALFRQIAAEAAALGAIGTAIGLAAGVLLAQALLAMVTRTINDHYFVLTTTQLLVTAAPLVKGALIGPLAAVAAAAMPAWEAATTLPQTAQQRSALEQRTRSRMPLLGAAALLSLVAAGAVLGVGDRLLSGFVGLFLIIVAFSLISAPLTAWLSTVGGRLAARHSRIAGLALTGVGAYLSRTGPAIAALAVAVATIVGVGTMIASFRQTVEHWLGQTLEADIYVSATDGGTSRASGRLPADLRARLARLPGIAATSTGRRLTLVTAGGDLEVLVLDPADESHAGFRMKEGDADAVWARLRQGALLVSEPYAWRHRIGPGDTVVLPTDEGERRFPVAGVFYDYSTELGMAVMHRSVWNRHFDDHSFSTIGLFTAPGADPDTVLERVHDALRGQRGVSVRANAEIRALSLAVFDRTFTITEVLRLLAVGIAFVGVLSALLALQLERAREFAILRSLGCVPRQVFALVLGQTGFIGLLAALVALPLGMTMAAVLIEVINRRSFGWSIDFTVPGWILLEAVAVAVGAALLAGLLPARRLATAPPAAALREE